MGSDEEKRNEYLIYFEKSTNGYRILVRIGREPKIPWPLDGHLNGGREMPADRCRRYVDGWVNMLRGQEKTWPFAKYDIEVDWSGLNE